MLGPRVVGEGTERGEGESKPQEEGQAGTQMYPKQIITQRSLHITGKKDACTHMLRSACAHLRCISHSSSAHARTSLEARVHAHRADRTQKSETSNVFKHHKHGKHAQTERSHRHGQGSGHASTKDWGRRHQI